ncbi:MAG: type II toxin-antitoxin system VapC family toxin [Kiritimatiellae bacterium]|nr:type II toxin-antitoxin system VapC family toxin [Kiritimatiellia bacterium]
MNAFVDTSSLFKKYVEEDGSEQFDSSVRDVDELIVSPVTWVEMHSVIQRRLREKMLTRKEAGWIEQEARRDFNYFRILRWTERLEQKAVEILRNHPLKTLDSIQLASAALVAADVFLTSDRDLFRAAKKETQNAVFIGTK